ncbi:hypothetical protein [Levilactobacillus enshiensis]|uniref:hypothetical protein n=1 Tax=Levilactobacillus enshiensis TaxID=2590213 RepID=UPI00117AE95F|nr:hypothetical protein [Levilactobacillus enshiensis]
MQRKTKMVTAVTAVLTVLTLGSGTVVQMHAANDVSAVGQTVAPKSASTDGTKLTAASTNGTKQNYTVKYDGNQNQSATLQKKTYGTNATAEKQVDYVGSNTDGATVKLNKNTTAVVQGTMGHTYVHWNKGDWSVTAVTSNADAAGTPKQFAKQVNQQLTKSGLPQHADTGAITVYSQTDDDEANSVTWQQGKQVYKVSGTTADTTVKVAQNTN